LTSSANTHFITDDAFLNSTKKEVRIISRTPRITVHLKNTMVARLVKNSLVFMQPENSLTISKEIIPSPYLESDESHFLTQRYNKIMMLTVVIYLCESVTSWLQRNADGQMKL
jgi:hypothetical protein